MLKSLRNVTESQNFLNGYGPSATSAISSQSPRPMPSSNGKEKGMQALAAARRSDYSSCATCHKRVQQPEFSVTARNGGLQEFCSSKCYFKFEHLRFCFTCHKKNFRPVHTVHGMDKIPDKLFCSNSCFNRYANSGAGRAEQAAMNPGRSSQLRVNPRTFKAAVTARGVESNVPLPQPPTIPGTSSPRHVRSVGAGSMDIRDNSTPLQPMDNGEESIRSDSRAETPSSLPPVAGAEDQGTRSASRISNGRLSRALLAHRSRGQERGSAAGSRAGSRMSTTSSRNSTRSQAGSRASARTPVSSGSRQGRRPPGSSRVPSKLNPASYTSARALAAVEPGRGRDKNASYKPETPDRWTPSNPLKVDRRNFRARDPITIHAEVREVARPK
eukprot:TRINITY_DN566_c0_g1_i7.p1 TRINITY_DN566_c0_g1~~TRINITY_DN566_c0_g1_i7.p1  ORF type:complete len:386 (+),score=38.63 TRINITY_DN566_c0_g1_i7:354-1511(+)